MPTPPLCKPPSPRSLASPPTPPPILNSAWGKGKARNRFKGKLREEQSSLKLASQMLSSTTRVLEDSGVLSSEAPYIFCRSWGRSDRSQGLRRLHVFPDPVSPEGALPWCRVGAAPGPGAGGGRLAAGLRAKAPGQPLRQRTPSQRLLAQPLLPLR